VTIRALPVVDGYSENDYELVMTIYLFMNICMRMGITKYLLQQCDSNFRELYARLNSREASC